MPQASCVRDGILLQQPSHKVGTAHYYSLEFIDGGAEAWRSPHCWQWRAETQTQTRLWSSVLTTAASQDTKNTTVPCTPHPILHPGPDVLLLESLLFPYLLKALCRIYTKSSFCSCFSFKEQHPVLCLRPFYSKQTLVTTIFFQLTFPPKPSAI